MRARRPDTETLASTALAGLAILHIAWARGASWPCADRASLADAAAGSSEVPGARACYAVAAGLAMAAGVVRKPSDTGPRRIGAGIIAGLLAGRGVIGVIGRTDRVMRSELSPRFRGLDRRVYAPACLALAGGIIASHYRPGRRRAAAQRALEITNAAASGGVRRLVIIASASANGKTTLGRELAAHLHVPFVELDGLVHGPGWAETPDHELRSLVEPTLRQTGWVIDGVYQRKIGFAGTERGRYRDLA